ncbi:hypothetical protein H0E84_03475 [Luteimonas sp. SJ-92]|uniref:Uncharacterized protein n=1 Tax=Luteimonas salinisoli TaxID=2752307 RepID=A0A853J9H7_9GAMM|nr:hypothetical protein [Luteimonas salinisoli]NZA25432.1 hypothetical protein [Luteimonas salinisoli]
MSGPKVVRVVTREEMVAAGERRLREVERVAAAWQARAATLGGLDEASRAAAADRIAALRALLAEDRFDELQAAATRERDFLRSDLAEREGQAVSRAAAVRATRRRRHENRRALLAALAANGSAAAMALAERLRGADEAVQEAALNEAFAWLAEASAEAAASGLNEAQRALAAALGPGGRPHASEEWRAGPDASRDARLTHIDRHISELQVLAEEAVAAPFIARLEAMERAPDDDRRNLMLDSLLLELAEASRAQARLRDRTAEMALLAAEAAPFLDSDAAAALLAEAEACESAGDAARVEALAARCREIVDAAAGELAARLRRETVLEALAGLGYEVREGMETAWAESGRLALRKAAIPGYGVEVGGQAATGRLQMRAVAFDAARDRGRDRDIETLWCDDYRQLEARLHEAGGTIRVERALAVGEVPLKEIAADASSTRRETEAPRQRNR